MPNDPAIEFDITRCPVAEYFAAHSLSDLCVSTWCNQDYALAEMWGGKLTRNETIAGGGNRCNFAFASADTPVKGGLTELREGGDSSLTSDPIGGLVVPAEDSTLQATVRGTP